MQNLKCVQCKKDLIGKQKLYCSKLCRRRYRPQTKDIYQTQRGIERKEYILNLFGNKCKICGYDKCTRALCFHHVNPSQKQFQLNRRKLSNSSMKKILEEVQKCILLCHNCHMELHDELVTLD